MKQFGAKFKSLLGLSLLALLGFLYVKSSSVDAGLHQQVSAQLRQLRELDDRINEYVLQARYRLLKNYDPIVTAQKQINDVITDLVAERPDLFATGQGELRQKFVQYLEERKRVAERIEMFKSQNAVLRNSERYLPIAVMSVLEGSDSLNEGDPFEQLIRDVLLNEMLMYQLLPSESGHQKIMDVLSELALSKESYPLIHQQQFETIILHSGILLAYKDACDQALHEIIQAPTIVLADEMYNLYSSNFQQAEHEANLYRFWLMVFALCGLIYGAYALIKMTQAQRELARSLRELEFQKFALDQHSIVSISDRAGIITYINHKFSEISQYPPSELIGQDHRILNSGFHPRVFFQDMWATIARGEVWQGEVRNRKKSGEFYWVDSTIVPFLDAEGKPERYVSIRTDITQRKTNDGLIKEASARLSLALEGSNLVMWDWNLSNNEVYLSEYWGDLLGLEHAATWTTATELNQLAHPDDQAMLQLRIIAVLKGEDSFYETEHRVRRVSGDWVWIQSHGKVVERDENGRALRMTGTNADITARKLTEAALQKAKESAEEVSRLKSDFLSNMSHEIRTPMNGIIGMTELALDTQLDEEQREYLTLVKSSAASLLGIINDILDFSKIEAGRLDVEVIEFSLEDLLRDTMKSLAHRAHQKNLELLLHIAPDVPERLMGDPGRIRQVLVNLVGNAVKFTERGEVEVSVKLLGEIADGVAEVQFSVRDTGIGIPLDKFKVIFESFSQADTSTTRNYGGTGLGLTISAQLVELMGGQIWPESSVGKGSTFFFNLKMPVTSISPYAAYQATGKVSGLPVLVVDDNKTNRFLLTEMLENWKMKPVAVASGKEALAELARAAEQGQPYSLALFDVQMPDMSGFELVEAVQRYAAGSAEAIMMLTSEGQRGDAQRCRELGISSYLLKPISQSELLDAIMTTLGEPERAQPTLVTRHTLRENRKNLNLLLAEDNAVNQTLALRLLEKLGHRVTLAKNGLEAVEQWSKGGFEAILMDVDMPKMNGYEATTEIRKLEAKIGQHIPIVAMTAHAMRGSREECLQAGMDGYISKPIDTEALASELDNIANGNFSSLAEHEPEESKALIVDFVKARTLMDNNKELFEEISRLFLIDGMKHLAEAQQAFSAGNSEQLKHHAHTIKGMVGVFAAERTTNAAAKVESLAGLAGTEQAMITLAKELKLLHEAVKSYQWT